MVQLDEALITQIGRRQRGGSKPVLNLGERIAVNLFYYRGVHMSVLMKVFQVSKNTLYGNAITGGGAYASGDRGLEVNEIINRIGTEAAYAQYVTPEMIRAVNAANEELVARKRLPHAA